MLAYFIDLERTSTKYLRTIYYRQESAKQQTAAIKCTRKPKISIFAPQGRLIAPIRVKFGMAEYHIGPLGPAKFKLNRCTGVGTRPQKLTISRSEPFERFLKLSWFFMHANTLQKCFKFDLIRFRGYGVIAEKPRVYHLSRIFPCTL